MHDRELDRRSVERRAVESAIWGMPLVSVDAMRQAFLRDAGGRYDDIVYLSKQADWKFQVTTPNASSWYAYIPLNTAGGPVVLEIPPAEGAGLFGSLNDAWQVPAADVGPAGSDGGRGGRYVVLPPGWSESVPADCFVVPLPTFNGYSLLRVIPRTTAPDDVARALALVRKVRAYRLADAADPPLQRFVDMAGKPFEGIARFDDTFFDSLARMVQEEPLAQHDLVAMALLRSIGIEKGRPFQPDAGLREILRGAAIEAHADFIAGLRALPAYWSARQWTLPARPVGAETGFTFMTGQLLDIDARGELFYFGCAPARRPGAATFYLSSCADAGGAPLQGGRKYRLRVPPDVPAQQFWAVTVYELETCAFVRGAERIELNSYDEGVARNADGSVDVTFAPRPPAGGKSNWVATPGEKPWVAMFRLYGPGASLFDKSWSLADIEAL
ncbi:DUF1254 domain-containing protein [Ramlibacter monticola]|uniref:DUF1254 domain-containing protein n=1 Tax=Ramlibacter monticola TaxID=1926872 RepID=A0A936Z8I2_9BURK|nr:DUF1254 domain-containing protein [Ramlibacter monticola]MBL0394571.1 DUF1254 domain-containing protein [Ramlibacter monticola]